MPRRGNAKAPDIDVLARHYLSRGLRKHPDVAKHVANINDLDQMPMWSLLTLAKNMGLDADATIRATEEQEDQRQSTRSASPASKASWNSI